MAKVKSQPKPQEKMRAAIRVAKFEVDSVDGADWKQLNERWFATMDLCRKAANLYYETWLVWHVQNRSALKLIEWFERRKAEGIKEAGPCPVEVLPKELAKLIYNTISHRHRSIQINVVTLLMQVLYKSLSSGKAAKGSLPKWSAILLHNEGMPMFTRQDFPIPFSPVNAKLIVDGEHRWIELKTWRLPVEGKAACVAVTDRIKLRMTGKRCKEQLLKFEKIASGEWAFKGSELCYDRNNKKWFVNLCYQCPSHVAELNPAQVAYLVPGRTRPFHLIVEHEANQWLQGRGHHITAMRERVWTKRAELNYGTKKTTSLRGGHGTKAAMKWRERWSRVWREFAKRVNHKVSKDAVDWCVLNGIGTLIYCKPNGRSAERRMVSGNYKNSTWEFFDLGSKLAYKCNDRGVVLKVLEFGKDVASGPVLSKTTPPLAQKNGNRPAGVTALDHKQNQAAVAKSTGRK